MMKWLAVAVCSLGLAAGCGDSGSKGADGAAGEGGGGGTVSVDASSAGTGGSVDANGSGGTGGTPSADGGPKADGEGAMVDAASGGDAGPGVDAPASDGGQPDGSAATMASVMITASAGGTLSSGGASLAVPPGGLTADKLLTLTVRAPAAGNPNLADIVGNIYEFGPDGTTFAVPVALTLPLTATVPADKKVVVAWLDVAGGQWFPVDSTVAGDKVIGRVSHFTHFALLLLPKDAFCPYAGACGGSLDGTWKYTATCLKTEESSGPPCGSAGMVPMHTVYEVGGTVTIAQGRFDADQTITATGTLVYSPACMAVLRESVPNSDCATLQEAWRQQNPVAVWICAGTNELGCTCTITNGGKNKAVGAVTVSGQQATFTQDGKPADAPSDFCVKGNNLSVRGADGVVYTAVKQ